MTLSCVQAYNRNLSQSPMVAKIPYTFMVPGKEQTKRLSLVDIYIIATHSKEI